MNKILNQQTVKIGIGFGLGYLAYKLICIFSNSQSEPIPPIPSCPSPDQLQLQSTLQSLSQLRNTLVHKSQNFQLETLSPQSQILSPSCILSFISQTEDIIDYKQLTQITEYNRLARRSVIQEIDGEFQSYFRFVCMLEESVKYVLEKGQKDFAVFVNLDYERIMDSIAYHIDNEVQDGQEDFRMQILALISKMRQNIHLYMPLASSPIPPQKIKQILLFQINLLETNEAYLRQLVRKMGLETKQQQQTIPLFLSCFLQDNIFLKFGIEPQQMSVGNEEINPQLEKLYEKFRVKRGEILRKICEEFRDDIVIQ